MTTSTKILLALLNRAAELFLNPRLHLILALAGIIILYFLGRNLFYTVVNEYYSKQTFNWYGFIIIKLAVIYHELAHSLAVIAFSILFLLTFWVPVIGMFANLWYAKLNAVHFSGEGNFLGSVDFEGGKLSSIIIALMPFGLIFAALLGLSWWWHLDLLLRLALAVPFFTLYFVPCIIGSFPSDVDLKQTVLLPVVLVVYIVYLWYYPVKIKPFLNVLFAVNISLLFVVLFKYCLVLLSKVKKQTVKGSVNA